AEDAVMPASANTKICNAFMGDLLFQRIRVSLRKNLYCRPPAPSVQSSAMQTFDNGQKPARPVMAIGNGW
ncbi:MAG: hypothetical protein WB821_13000, partial [Burkholderiaceae bacterium]